jgi:hypothetical protein
MSQLAQRRQRQASNPQNNAATQATSQKNRLQLIDIPWHVMEPYIDRSSEKRLKQLSREYRNVSEVKTNGYALGEMLKDTCLQRLFNQLSSVHNDEFQCPLKDYPGSPFKKIMVDWYKDLNTTVNVGILLVGKLDSAFAELAFSSNEFTTELYVKYDDKNAEVDIKFIQELLRQLVVLLFRMVHVFVGNKSLPVKRFVYSIPYTWGKAWVNAIRQEMRQRKWYGKNNVLVDAQKTANNIVTMSINNATNNSNALQQAATRQHARAQALQGAPWRLSAPFSSSEASQAFLTQNAPRPRGQAVKTMITDRVGQVQAKVKRAQNNAVAELRRRS